MICPFDFRTKCLAKSEDFGKYAERSGRHEIPPIWSPPSDIFGFVAYGTRKIPSHLRQVLRLNLSQRRLFICYAASDNQGASSTTIFASDPLKPKKSTR